MLARHGRSQAHEIAGKPLTVSLALALPLLCGLLIAQTSTMGAIVLVAAVAIPFIALVEGAPLFVFLAIYPILTPWTFAGVGAEHAMGLLCLVAWGFGVLLRRQPLQLPSSLASGLILLYFLVSLISIVTMTSANSAYLIRIYVLNAALFVLAQSCAGTRVGLMRALQALVAGAAMVGLLALFSFLQGRTIPSQGLERLGLEGVGVNVFAAVLLLGSGVALGLAVGEQRKRQLSILWLVGIALTILIVLSQSRGAFVGQLMLVAVGILFGDRGRRRFLVMLPMLLVTSLVLAGIGRSGIVGEYSSRVLDLISGGEALETARPHLWEMARQAFVENPLFGVGVGNFTNPTVWYELATATSAPTWIFPLADAHSFYLSTLAELGLAGFIPLMGGLLLIVVSVARIAWRASTTRLATVSGPAYALLFGSVAFFTAIAFLPSRTLALPYVLLGIAEGFRRMTANDHLPSSGSKAGGM